MAYQRFGTRQILFKKEVTEGTDPVPTGAANALVTFNADLQLQVDSPTRTPDRAYFTADDVIEIGWVPRPLATLLRSRRFWNAVALPKRWSLPRARPMRRSRSPFHRARSTSFGATSSTNARARAAT